MDMQNLKYEDVIDVRDIIERVEELREERDDFEHDEDGDRLDHDWAKAWPEDAEELNTLEELLGDIKGNGGDEQWEGDWYPVTLIRDSYFKDYAQELADDMGALPKEYSWPSSCIDWDQAARELRMDYTSTEIDGVTYWYR